MTTAILLFGTVLAIWLAHRMALWVEARGWLYYRNRRPTSATLGAAFLEVQHLVDPGKRLVLEAKRENQGDHEASGDPPDKAR